MALGAGVFLLAGAGLVVLGVKNKKKTKKANGKALKPKPPLPPEEMPTIRWDGEEWFMPEGWLEVYATPIMQEYVFGILEAEPKPEPLPEIDALSVALRLLEGQVNAFPLPAGSRPPTGEMWQAMAPNTENYYPGPESVLGLFYHVAEYVEEGLSRWQAGDDLYLVEISPYEEVG
jgi:hypothetical protein